jgi:DNA repair protein RadA/Sms
VPADLVAFGEVGLGGEVRPVPQLERRLAEAARLGFRRALIPAANQEPRAPVDLDLMAAASVAEALEAITTAEPVTAGPAGRR